MSAARSPEAEALRPAHDLGRVLHLVCAMVAYRSTPPQAYSIRCTVERAVTAVCYLRSDGLLEEDLDRGARAEPKIIARFLRLRVVQLGERVRHGCHCLAF